MFVRDKFNRINMENSLKLQNKTFHIKKSNLNNVHKFLLQLEFELFEVWTNDNVNEEEIWKKKQTDEILRLKICQNDHRNNNISKIISEMIDLWHELRGIRELLEFDSIDNYIYEKPVFKTSFQIFNENLKEMEENWEENDFKQLFKEDIDPSILTYVMLDDDEKFALTN